MKKLIDVYPYKIKGGQPLFLIFKRSSEKIYGNQWRMVGGKVKEGETSWEGALRELKEETGLSPVKFWTIPSVNQFYEAKSDSVHAIPAFAAELSGNKEIKLDDEHSEYKWVSIEGVEPYISWPEQRRLMKMMHDILTDQFLQILPEWIIDIS
ncbi:MAG: NUDIX domain-containing protein [Gracilimonas sp.]|uniref:NUDIX hydrolase n=1 Tax=Gracilimonas TaxID=649462 RepID=UPI001B0F60C7|nr:NUDIX domain-containing protein [Gracilimonas sp.]MBO6586373.1 NUDIX domain-containing protein [Gracilimonas sp.]MBO6615030.1 NUDIX domain-containing protein [Gracilimonas sp.]